MAGDLNSQTGAENAKFMRHLAAVGIFAHRISIFPSHQFCVRVLPKMVIVILKILRKKIKNALRIFQNATIRAKAVR